MATVRGAEVEWIGGLKDGEGKIVSTTTGALPELEVTWNGRVNEDQTITSPEELLAAAHASCFAMQFSLASSAPAGGRRRSPSPPRSRSRSASGSPLGATVRVAVDGLTDDQIPEIAEQAKANAPCRGRSRVSTSSSTCPTWRPLPRRRPEPHPQPKPETSGEAASPLDAARLGAVMAGFDDLIDELERSYREAAGAHVRPEGLQRPPGGEGGRPAPEGARGVVQAGGELATGARRPRGGAERPRARGDGRRATRPTSSGSRTSSSCRSSRATPPTRRT